MSLNLQLKNQRSCANAGNHRSNSPSCLVVAVVLASWMRLYWDTCHSDSYAEGQYWAGPSPCTCKAESLKSHSLVGYKMLSQVVQTQAGERHGPVMMLERPRGIPSCLGGRWPGWEGTNCAQNGSAWGATHSSPTFPALTCHFPGPVLYSLVGAA